MIPAEFDYVRPGSIEEAAQAAGRPGAKVIAGGQSLLPLMKLRLARPSTIVDIGRIPGLTGTRYTDDGGAEMGAMTTYAQVIAETKLEWTREALLNIGDVQVRNRGTVGGAIAHADPAADVPAVSLALDYSAVLRSPRGERVVPLDGFFTGPFMTTAEPDETVLVNLSSPGNALVGDAQGVATITNDDLPALTINDVSVTEGSSPTTATLTVTLAPASTQTVTVGYATANGTASAGSDYVSKTGTLTFAPGVTTQVILVTVSGDTTTESDETVLLNLSSPTNAVLGDAQGVVTITNNVRSSATPIVGVFNTAGQTSLSVTVPYPYLIYKGESATATITRLP